MCLGFSNSNISSHTENLYSLLCSRHCIAYINYLAVATTVKVGYRSCVKESYGVFSRTFHFQLILSINNFSTIRTETMSSRLCISLLDVRSRFKPQARHFQQNKNISSATCSQQISGKNIENKVKLLWKVSHKSVDSERLLTVGARRTWLILKHIT